RDARRGRGPARAGRRRRERQGLDGQSLGRRGSGSCHRGGGRCDRRPRRERGMSMRLRDTLSGEVRPLEPLEPDHVRIYSCVPTVYGPTHIGNFRSFLFADVLVRYLRYRGLRVTWVMNVTDVDDRIIANANAAGEAIGELTGRWLERFKTDFEAVRMTPPDVLPRATEHIPEMAAIIGRLLDKGHAYRTDDGSIFFRISS